MIKKNLKKIMITILIILLVTISLGIGAYAAYVLNATEVQYTNPSGTTLSVKAALDDLYSKGIDFHAGDYVRKGTQYFYVLYDSPKSNPLVTVITSLNIASRTYQSASGAGKLFATDYFAEMLNSRAYMEGDFEVNGAELIQYCDQSPAMTLLASYGDYIGAVSCRMLSYNNETGVNDGTWRAILGDFASYSGRGTLLVYEW